jgi:hypothetical protein
VKALVQREDSLIKPRQSQNRVSGFSTELFTEGSGIQGKPEAAVAIKYTEI